MTVNREVELGHLASAGTDQEWFEATGACGGCGGDCGCGGCVGSVCLRCENRKAQGFDGTPADAPWIALLESTRRRA